MHSVSDLEFYKLISSRSSIFQDMVYEKLIGSWIIKIYQYKLQYTYVPILNVNDLGYFMIRKSYALQLYTYACMYENNNGSPLSHSTHMHTV